MPDEARLVEKLRAIEALYAGAMTPGERDAADRARQRIIARIAEVQSRDPAEEFAFSMTDPWSRRLFIALLKRYELRPYRYRRQRQTTVMAKMPKSFADEILMPEFNKLCSTLYEYLDGVTDRVLAQVFDADGSDAESVDGAPKAIPASVDK